MAGRDREIEAELRDRGLGHPDRRRYEHPAVRHRPRVRGQRARRMRLVRRLVRDRRRAGGSPGPSRREFVAPAHGVARSVRPIAAERGARATRPLARPPAVRTLLARRRGALSSASATLAIGGRRRAVSRVHDARIAADLPGHTASPSSGPPTATTCRVPGAPRASTRSSAERDAQRRSVEPAPRRVRPHARRVARDDLDEGVESLASRRSFARNALAHLQAHRPRAPVPESRR